MAETTSERFEISDVHAHLQDKRLGETREDAERVLNCARERGVVRFVCAGTSPGDWNRTADFARRLPDVYPMFGTHPWNVGKISGDWLPVLKSLLVDFVAFDGKTRAGLGEVGLDFAVRDCDDSVKKAQEDAFRAQLAFANELAIPVAVHSVRANDRVLKAMREFPKVPVWLLHGWIASPEEIDRALDLGAFFSFSARNVAPNAIRARATIASVSRDKILLESDGPIMLPPDGYSNAPVNAPTTGVEALDADGVPIDSPRYLTSTARAICELRKYRLDEFLRQIGLNERRFFQHWPK